MQAVLKNLHRMHVSSAGVYCFRTQVPNALASALLDFFSYRQLQFPLQRSHNPFDEFSDKRKQW